MEPTFLVCAMIATPTAAAIGAVVGRWSPDIAARCSAWIAALGWVAAAGLAIMGAVTPSPNALVDIGLVSLSGDWLAVVMLLLVLGLSTIVQFFAVRYLFGDPRQVWFVVTANLVTASTALMVTSASVLLFGLAWVAAGASLVALLATYPGLTQAREGVRRTAVRFALGDLPLLVAITVLMVTSGGDVAFADLGTAMAAFALPWATVIAVLLIVPALARSSQVPFHGWLPFTLAAPTPVSALMHAGVVNAGAILILRFSPTLAESPVAMAVIFTAGAATLLYASVVRLTKPDVKGRLVFSTMAQMGFMMLACGLGAFAAALFHLVAHGLFKATLFLGAGSGVSREVRHRRWPRRSAAQRPLLIASVAIALTVAVGSLLIARLALGVALSSASQGLQVFVVFTASVALATALATHFSLPTGLLGGGAVIALTFGYTALIGLFDNALGFAPFTTAVNAWWLLVPGAGLLALQLLMRPGLSNGLSRRVYAIALAAGSTQPRLSMGPTTPMGVSS